MLRGILYFATCFLVASSVLRGIALVLAHTSDLVMARTVCFRHGVTEFELDTGSQTIGTELLARMFGVSVRSCIEL